MSFKDSLNKVSDELSPAMESARKARETREKEAAAAKKAAEELARQTTALRMAAGGKLTAYFNQFVKAIGHKDLVCISHSTFMDISLIKESTRPENSSVFRVSLLEFSPTALGCGITDNRTCGQTKTEPQKGGYGDGEVSVGTAQTNYFPASQSALEAGVARWLKSEMKNDTELFDKFSNALKDLPDMPEVFAAAPDVREEKAFGIFLYSYGGPHYTND